MGFHGKQILPGTLPLNRLYTTGYVPSAADDLTTVAYVQALNAGLFPKAEARVRATGNISIASPPSVIDGENMNDGDRVVLGDQTVPSENGIYIWHVGGMVRSLDGDSAGDLKLGTFIYVQEGTTWGGFGFFISGTPASPPNINIGTDPITFSTLQKQNQYTVDNGISLVGNVFSLGGGLSQNTLISGGGSFGMKFGGMADFEVETSASRFLFDKGGSVMRIENNAGTQVLMDLKSGWRFNLAMDDGGGAGQVNANWSVNLAPNGVINDTHIVNAATNVAFAAGSKYSFAAGRNHMVGSTGTRGDSSTSLGVDTINDGEGGITSGIGAQLLYVANQRGGIVHGLSTGVGLKPIGVPYVTASAGAVNISRNTVAQTSGNGALAQDSVILGGYDHHIPASSPGSVILGGSGISARTLAPNQVYVPTLNIMTVPGTGAVNDSILVRDGLTGEIKQIDQGDIAGSVGDGNGTTGNNGAADWGGTVFQNVDLIGIGGFGVNQEYGGGGFWNVYNYQTDNTSLYSGLSMVAGDFEQMVYDPGVWQGVFTISSSAFGNGQNIRLQANDLAMSTSTTFRTAIGVVEISSNVGTFPGAVYAADYSANYTNRSLVDKEYVDNMAGSFTLTNGNGTTANGTSVDLGGPLTANVAMTGAFQYSMSGLTNFTLQANIAGGRNARFGFSDGGGYSYLRNDNAGFTQSGQIKVGLDYVLIYANDAANNASIQVDDNAITVQGNGAFPGMRYQSDYSANFTARSLVDKGYVDNAITASNGLSKVVNNIRLGGTLDANTVINGEAVTIQIRMADLLTVPTVQSELLITDSAVSLKADDVTNSLGSVIMLNTNGTVNIESVWSNALAPTTFNIDENIEINNASSFSFNNGMAVAGITYSTSHIISQSQYDAYSWYATSTDTLNDNLTQILSSTWSLSDGFQLYRQRYSDTQPDSIYAMFQMNIDNALISIYDQSVTGSGAHIGVDNSGVNADYTPFASTNDNTNNSVKTAFRLRRIATGTGTTNPNAIGVGARLDYELLIGPIQQVVSGAIDNIATAIGAGWETKMVVHVGNTGALIPVMEIDKYGAKHAANYSANYTSRSLVDKEYVDSTVASSSVTASNGLTKVGSDIKFGGALTANTSITGAFSMNFANGYVIISNVALPSTLNFSDGTVSSSITHTIGGRFEISTPIGYIFSQGATERMRIAAGGDKHVVINLPKDDNAGLIAYSSSTVNTPTAEFPTIGYSGNALGRAGAIMYSSGSNNLALVIMPDTSSPTGNLLSVSNGDLTDYNGYLATISHTSTSGALTAGTTKPMLRIIKSVSSDGGFDHTGAFIEMLNDTELTGNYIRAWNGATEHFVVKADGSIIAGTSTAPSGSLSYTFGDGNINRGIFGSVMFGELSEIDVNVGAALNVGENNYISAYGGHTQGRGVAVTGDYSWAGGWYSPNSQSGKTNPKAVLVAGAGSFGFFETDGSQTNGHGVLAASSAVLGGLNPNIPVDSPRSVILGGSGIKARAADPDQVYVPNFNIVVAPANDDSLTQILARDGVTGEVKYRTAASLGGGGSIPAPQEDDKDMIPAVTTGNNQPTGLTITNTPTGLIIIALNGEIKSLGNGVKTKHCYFSNDGGVTARAYNAIVATDELYWNGVIAGYDLDASDVIDFYYI